MASTDTVISKSSPLINYKCCKSKQFIHYVCTKCFSVFHKSCLLSRYKSQVSFIEENKIICCKDEDESYQSEQDAEKSLLEKTISELSGDSEMKSKYIHKLKTEYKLIVDEASKMEEEMNRLIKDQEKIIHDLQEEIRHINKNTKHSKKTLKNVSSQTRNVTKNTRSVSTNTKSSIKFTSGVEENYVNAGTQTFINLKSNEDMVDKSISDLQSQIKPAKHNNSLKLPDNSINKHKVLLLCDDYGRNINKIMHNMLLSGEYHIETIIKPGASFHQVIENIDLLTVNYGIYDYIIIIAGSNNFNKNHKYPSFRNIWEKIKQCSHSNIIITTVPYRNSKVDKFIYKFNKKLSDFVWKLNKYVPGKVNIVDVNNKISKFEISNMIVTSMFSKTNDKNLVFVEMNNNHSIHVQSAETIDVDAQETFSLSQDNTCDKSKNLMYELMTSNDTTSLNHSVNDLFFVNNTSVDNLSIVNNDNNFLYPRLSQLTLM